MCLGVPGQIIAMTGEDPLFRVGTVDFAGLKRDVQLAYVPEAKVGDYVIVHAGVAISRIDPVAAAQTLGLLESLEEPHEIPE